MSNFLLAMTAGVFLFGLYSLFVGLFRPGRRKTGWRNFGLSVVALFAASIAAGTALNHEARVAGFANASEMNAARQETDTQNSEERKRTAGLEFEKQRAVSVAAAEAESKLAFVAGFPTVETFREAKAAGVTTHAAWVTQQNSRAADERKRSFNDAVGKRLLSVNEFVSSDFNNLIVQIETLGFDGGASDFFKLADDVTKLLSAVREQEFAYDQVNVMIAIPTVDKYGNPTSTDGGTLSWDGPDIEKLNPEALQQVVMRLASQVSLTGLGKQLSDPYCKKWELGDPRFCN